MPRGVTLPGRRATGDGGGGLGEVDWQLASELGHGGWHPLIPPESKMTASPLLFFIFQAYPP